MSLINFGRSADKQILTECYLGDILERLQRGVFTKRKHKHALLRLTFVITSTQAMNKEVTGVPICEVRRGHASLLVKHICDFIHATEIVTK
jgi:hypothetical protein